MQRATLLALATFVLLALAASAVPGAEDAEAPQGAKVTLRYEFRPGETVRWQVVHEATVKTTVSGNTQTAETLSRSVKVWKITQVDAEGNVLRSHTDASGRYHSDWLTMMYPRLFLARQLLKEDGIILVSIDDHEAQNLRLLMNEVFGEENFVAQLVWEKGRKNDARLFSVGHEYMIAYAHSLDTLRQLKRV